MNESKENRKRLRGANQPYYLVAAICNAEDNRNDIENSRDGENQALLVSTPAVGMVDTSTHGRRRACRNIHHGRSATFMYCLYFVLMLAAFLIGKAIGQTRHKMKVESYAKNNPRHRVNVYERDTIINSTITSRNSALVIGGAGFIGMHTSLKLQSLGSKVIVLDNMNEKQYSSNLKKERSRILEEAGIDVVVGDACNETLMRQIIADNSVYSIVYLASQSFERKDGAVKRPFQYPLNNMDCFVTVLDVLRKKSETSSSLVYASDYISFNKNATVPGAAANDETRDPTYNEDDDLRYNEMIARAYSNLYGISSVGLRLGTVVGPYGRPDMSYYNAANRVETRRYTHVNTVVSRIATELRSHDNGFKVVAITENDNDKMSNDGVDDFTEWYQRAKGEQYVSMSPSRTADLMTPSSLATPRGKKEICFVTALFSDNSNLIERESPQDLSNYTQLDPSLKHYYFTNVHGLPSNGWEVVVMDDFPFSRFITQSRWPKFMGFRHEKLQSCTAIIYSDANRPPRDLSVHVWRDLVNRLRDSNSGIMQDRRPSSETVLHEMHTIVSRKKDYSANIDMSKKWFLDQDDFNDNAVGFWNMAIVIDPNNKKVQDLLTTLWAHYSNEEGTWRDQPLYRYLIDKLKLNPLPLGGHSRFFHRVASSGKHHHYNEDGGVNWTEKKKRSKKKKHKSI